MNSPAAVTRGAVGPTVSSETVSVSERKTNGITRVTVSASRASMRVLFALLGLLAMVIALIGVWLPGLPTTPFILVALWAFSKSSERLAAWFMRVPVLRGAIEMAERFKEERTLPLWVRVFAPTVACASTVFVHLTIGSRLVTGIVGAAALTCILFVLITPTDEPRPEVG